MPLSDLYVGERPWSDGYFLKHDVCNSRDSLRVDWTCTLMEVYDHERSMEGGRFRYFARDEREHCVEIRLDSKTQPWVESVSQRVNWIAEHADCRWSMTVDMLSVESGIFRYSFDDISIATMFKLVFA